MPSKNIVFFTAENPYNSTPIFASSFAKALTRQGSNVRVLSFAEEHIAETLEEVFNNPPDCTCSFSDITLGGVAIGEMWHIPHISLLVDPFVYFLHQANGPFSSVTTPDMEEYALLKALGCEKTLFLPHAVPYELANRKSKKERPFDIVFFGTAIDIEEIERGWVTHSYGKLLMDAADKVLSAEGLSCYGSLSQLGLNTSTPLFFELFRELDLYVRGKDRLELIESLSGLPITIFGDKIGKKGWMQLLKSQPNVSVFPPLPFKKTISIMEKAKIVLNSNPRLKHGSHERMFYGMATGGVVITGESRFTNEYFVTGEDLLTYTYGKGEEIYEQAAGILGSFSKWEAISNKGKQRVLQEHTWDNRAKTLLAT